MKRLIACVIAVSLSLLQPAHAADGELDRTFGVGGRVRVGSSVESGVLTIQSDGKIVVAAGSEGDFLVARFNNEGLPDSTFGIEGRVITDFMHRNIFFSGGDPLGDYPYALAI